MYIQYIHTCILVIYKNFDGKTGLLTDIGYVILKTRLILLLDIKNVEHYSQPI